MLNAYRRHWNLHQGDFLPDGMRRVSAQRLSASLESSHAMTGPIVSAFSICAQRLSASLESSLGIRDALAGLTLSAQRLSASLESSPICPFAACRFQRVLNAYRRHWNLHIKLPSNSCRFILCSTPIGVIGIFTFSVKAKVNPRKQVLNAYRRHWNLHPSDYESSEFAHMVLNAYRRHWNLHVQQDADKLRR